VPSDKIENEMKVYVIFIKKKMNEWRKKQEEVGFERGKW
jgi:hypothetical protein